MLRTTFLSSSREILPEKLREQGAVVDVAPVYQTVTAEADGETLKTQLADGSIDLVTFTSSSTVTNLIHIVGSSAALRGVKTAVIGPVTAETAVNNGIEPDIVAKEYTIDGLIEAIKANM